MEFIKLTQVRINANQYTGVSPIYLRPELITAIAEFRATCSDRIVMLEKGERAYPLVEALATLIIYNGDAIVVAEEPEDIIQEKVIRKARELTTPKILNTIPSQNMKKQNRKKK